jgi:hypothetical protein
MHSYARCTSMTWPSPTDCADVAALMGARRGDAAQGQQTSSRRRSDATETFSR